MQLNGMASGRCVSRNEEAIFATKRLGVYAYELDWGVMTRRDYKLYLHVFKEKKRVELLNVGNKVKKAYILETGQELEYLDIPACEGNGLIEVEIPKEYQDKKYYVICLETMEKEPIFEPIA